MTAEFGAPSQLEKIEMLDYADLVAINKFSRRGSEDALRDVRKQYQRNQRLFGTPGEQLPVFGTSAADFHDRGVNALYGHLVGARWWSGSASTGRAASRRAAERTTDSGRRAIPRPARALPGRDQPRRCAATASWAAEQAELAGELEALERTLAHRWPGAAASARDGAGGATCTAERDAICAAALDPACLRTPRGLAGAGTPPTAPTATATRCAGARWWSTTTARPSPAPRFPRWRGRATSGWGDRLLWRLLENVPGEFPFTGGVFPFKRTQEDPTRMFAGEGPAERTNRRFHYLADGQPAKRLSTAFDSITLYGEDPDERPDIYGKIGESGVSVVHRRGGRAALRRLRPLRPDHLGVDDHQRSGADGARLLLQHRHPPAGRASSCASRGGSSSPRSSACSPTPARRPPGRRCARCSPTKSTSVWPRRR